MLVPMRAIAEFRAIVVLLLIQRGRHREVLQPPVALGRFRVSIGTDLRKRTNSDREDGATMADGRGFNGDARTAYCLNTRLFFALSSDAIRDVA